MSKCYCSSKCRRSRRWLKSEDNYILNNCRESADYERVARALSRSRLSVYFRYRTLCGTIDEFRDLYLNERRCESRLFSSSFKIGVAEKAVGRLAREILDYCLADCTCRRVKVDVKISSI